jgi:hypothetical protein
VDFPHRFLFFFLVRAGTDFSFQFPDRPCSVPAPAKVIARSECLLFPVLFFSLSAGRARRSESLLLLAAQWPSWLFFASLVHLHPDFSIPAAASPGRRRLCSLSSAFPFRLLHPVVFSVRYVFFPAPSGLRALHTAGLESSTRMQSPGRRPLLILSFTSCRSVLAI